MSIKSVMALLTRGAGHSRLAFGQFASALDRVDRESQILLIKTQGKHSGRGPWSSQFRATVTVALETAQQQAELAQKLADPKYKEIFERNIAALNVDCTKKNEALSEPDWVRDGPPKEPINLPNDPEKARFYRQGFDEYLREQAEFERDFRRKVEGQPAAVRREFREVMTARGVGRLLDVYFPGL